MALAAVIAGQIVYSRLLPIDLPSQPPDAGLWRQPDGRLAHVNGLSDLGGVPHFYGWAADFLGVDGDYGTYTAAVWLADGEAVAGPGFIGPSTAIADLFENGLVRVVYMGRGFAASEAHPRSGPAVEQDLRMVVLDGAVWPAQEYLVQWIAPPAVHVSPVNGRVFPLNPDVTTTGAVLAGQAGYAVPDGVVDLDDLSMFVDVWRSWAKPIEELVVLGVGGVQDE